MKNEKRIPNNVIARKFIELPSIEDNCNIEIKLKWIYFTNVNEDVDVMGAWHYYLMGWFDADYTEYDNQETK